MTIAETEIAIVGAGVSGLALAQRLSAGGRSVVVLEGRDRIGGRVFTDSAGSDFRYDLGPAWMWPHNTRLLKVVDELGLRLMRQHSQGHLVFQDQSGAIQRNLDFATMGDALRLEGGMTIMAKGLAATLPARTVHLQHRVTKIEQIEVGALLVGDNADGAFQISAQKAVLALPPRLVAQTIAFNPPLKPETHAALAGVPTWMAGHGKIVAVYDKPFWREMGLSGDAISHLGPLMEIHDASPVSNPKGEAALFGFVHPGILERDPTDAALRAAAVDQLTALFGSNAAKPIAVLVKTWASDDLTATPHDKQIVAAHPTYQPILIADEPGLANVSLSGSETAREHGGFLEGALEAAEQTYAELAGY